MVTHGGIIFKDSTRRISATLLLTLPTCLNRFTIMTYWKVLWMTYFPVEYKALDQNLRVTTPTQSVGVAKRRYIVRHFVKRLNKIRELTSYVAKIVLRESNKSVPTHAVGQLPLIFTIGKRNFCVCIFFSAGSLKWTNLMCGCVISVVLLINIFSILICLLFWFGFWSFSDDRPNFGKKSKLENRFFIDRTITSDSLANTHERDHKLF